MEDLYFAQGYVHAQDRFWQMEFWRRVSSGRLAELFGEDVLGIDIYIRNMGFTQIAQQEYAMLSEETRSLMEAYSSGVNAYILNRKPAKLGLEFALLTLRGVEFEIEPWTPVNTLNWMRLTAENMSGNMQRELYSMELIRAVGLDMSADFFPDYREDEMPLIISDDEISMLRAVRKNEGPRKKTEKTVLANASAEAEKPDRIHRQSLSDEHLNLLNTCSTELLGGEAFHTLNLFGRENGIGSNSWALSGSLTESGMPILANDAHLATQMPSIWYEIGLHSKEGGGKTGTEPLNVRGYSFAGVPGILIGQNDRIAWGFTVMYPDIKDLYIERINPYNINQYEVNGEWVDMKLRTEEIQVHKWDEPYRFLARSTRHGPIVTDHGTRSAHNSFNLIPGKLFPENLELTALSLRWTALQPLKLMDMIITLNSAQNFDDFREAMRLFTVPVLNALYADVDGI
jgi:penicillin amidase